MRFHSLVVGALLLWAGAANATIYGSVRGLIHDPQHRPVQGAEVVLRAESSEWAKTVASDARGEFRFDAVPLGGYRVNVTAEGFAAQSEALLLQSQRDAEMIFRCRSPRRRRALKSQRRRRQ
jgi:hypothetical protein